MNRLKMVGIGVCLTAALLLAAPPASAVSYGHLIGYPTSQQFFYGPAGGINKILIGFNTADGLTWTLVCRLSAGNLGLCNDAPVMGTLYEAKGTFSSSGLELTSYGFY